MCVDLSFMLLLFVENNNNAHQCTHQMHIKNNNAHKKTKQQCISKNNNAHKKNNNAHHNAHKKNNNAHQCNINAYKKTQCT